VKRLLAAGALLTSLDTKRLCETRKALLAGIAFHLVS
jgi:hypothetical protein